MNSAILPISESTCVLRATDKYKGRSRALAPGGSAVRWLHYGRIILDAGDPALVFNNDNHETGLICLKGKATVTVAGQTFALALYDALYIPRDSRIEVLASDEGCDFAEVSAPVEGHYPMQFVPFSTVRSDPGLHFKAGSPSSQRDLNILIGKNVEAGRIVAGVTFSEPGNWTSWPPHEHAELLEEAYLYINMPKPAWGVQFVYTNPSHPELAAVVHEGDCVVMPQGYHPNVSAPGGSINFLWMMAAHRETTDRLFGVVNVQPEYATGGSGLERGQK
jgi:5-deoxy-glucuronate isomerase